MPMTKKRACNPNGSKKGGLGLSDTRAAYFLLAPFLVFFALFVAYPALMNVYYSFTNYNLTENHKWVGFFNYGMLLRDRVFRISFANTALYALVSVLGLVAGGLAAALALTGRARIVGPVRMLCLFPYATSMTAVSMIWLMLLDPLNGFLNKVLLMMGLPAQPFLFSEGQALFCLIFVNIWKNLGYCMLIMLTGIHSIDKSLYEAARVDGAGSWQQLFHITLPTLSPTILFVLVTSTTESFKTFEQVQIMTRGDPLYATTTIVHQIYLRGFSEYKMGYASAMSVVLLAVLLFTTALQFRIMPREASE